MEVGDLAYVRRRINEDWIEGERNGFIGIFPATYVRVSLFQLLIFYNFNMFSSMSNSSKVLRQLTVSHYWYRLTHTLDLQSILIGSFILYRLLLRLVFFNIMIRCMF